MQKKLIISLAASGLAIVAIIASYGAYRSITNKRTFERLEAERIAAQEKLIEDTARYEAFLENNDAFFEGSFLNGKDISGMKADEVKEMFINDFCDNKITIHVEDTNQEYTLSFKAFNLSFNPFKRYVNVSLREQQMTLDEFLTTPKRKDYNYDFMKDVNLNFFEDSNLIDFFSDNVIESSDAYALVNPETGEITVEPEVFGNEVSFDILKNKISEALSSNTFDITVTSDDYIKPQLLATDEKLLSRVEKLETIKNKEMSIKLCGENTTLSGPELWKLLDSSDDLVSDKALNEYLEKIKNTYDSCYFNRPFTTSFGQEIVLESGNYGWVIDAKKTASTIIKAVNSSNMTPSFEVSYSRYGQRPALHEFNDTYIEVSIEGQHIWAYVNGECLLSDDIVSGEVTTNNPETITNRGVFRLSYKQHTAILRGADYEEPVTFWMPFDGGIGFHDATWRDDSEFGGEIYKGNGSHGCVNMRYGSAEILFGIINDEMPIIVW